MAQSLIEHETISTTIQKAKEVKPFVEKLITLAKKGKLQHRRRAISLLGNRRIVAIEDGEPVRKGTVVGKLFSELGPRYLDRPGGYTRIIRLSLRRLGDNGQLVLLQLLGKDEPVKKEGKVARSAARTGNARKRPGQGREGSKQGRPSRSRRPLETSAAEAPAEHRRKPGSREVRATLDSGAVGTAWTVAFSARWSQGRFR